jgi:uncharacterized protein (DUF2236 family)/Ca2+-binding EF-hand superfamily protein
MSDKNHDTGAPAPGPGSVLWRTIGQRRLLLVIGRLLVLQAAHPAVGAGLVHHSTYRAHAWRRVDHTLESLTRFAYADPDERAREIGRVNRAHRHINGTDERGRTYDAIHPDTRAWVLLTVYEALVTLERLGGTPLSPEDRDRLYREWAALMRDFVPESEIPPTEADFWAYFRAAVDDTLEDNAEVRHLFRDFYRQIPAPPWLRWCPPLWSALRVLAASVMGSLNRADLPAAYTARLGLRARSRDRVLSWVVHRGVRHVMAALPLRGRYFAAAAAALQGRTAPDAQGRVRLRGRARRVPAPRTPHRTRRTRLEHFFDQVLDQTGNGSVTLEDLNAMARSVCWQLELTDAQEASVYAGFCLWWEQMRAAMDADGDGRISKEEWVTASLRGADQEPDYLEHGLYPAMRAVFDAADTDGSGWLGQTEYRKVFGPKLHPSDLSVAFRGLDADGDGRVSRDEFLTAFEEFFTARGDTAAGTHLLG